MVSSDIIEAVRIKDPSQTILPVLEPQLRTGTNQTLG